MLHAEHVGLWYYSQLQKKKAQDIAELHIYTFLGTDKK
jgi:hypothetical protein